MSSEVPNISHNKPNPPAGVPGDRDTTFDALDELLHANLKARYGTDDPKRLEGITGAQREEIMTRFGAPADLKAHDQYEDFNRMRERTDRIKVVTQMRSLQEDWNKRLSRRALLQAELTTIENRLAEIGDVTMVRHPVLWAESRRLLGESFKLRSQIGAIESNIASTRAAMKGLGSNPPDDYSPFFYRELNDEFNK